jgi:hypothetical protein
MRKEAKYLELYLPHWMDITWFITLLLDTCLLSSI